ncbi:MAG: argininosuccinate lyase [Christensenellales bacterium]|jgi:argininosuccinate lyase
MKLWSGRFTKNSTKLADDFNSSLSIDFRLYSEDISGSIAHCKMLHKTGLISKEESDKIIKGLMGIESDIDNGTLVPDDSEDIHMFIEAELTKRIGECGKKLHTARSRNDQVATDMRLYAMNSVDNIKSLLNKLIHTLIDISYANLDTYMPGFTHMQKAQPVTLAHHLSAYCEMFTRDIERLNDSLNRIGVLPLGSCALAGTPLPVDREYTAELLGFNSVSRSSMDSVSDRDFALDFIYNSAMIMMHLSRFAEEIITWASDEYRFIELDDAHSTGSSIMPQKKNPDMAELVRGKTGRVYGDLITLLTVMKGIPLAYNKDMQEDKEAFFDAEDTVTACLNIFIEMLPAIKFNKDVMALSASGGYTNATDVADYLAAKGVPFRTAHEITGKIVLYAISNSKKLEELTLDEFNSFTYNKRIFDKDIYDMLSLESVVTRRSSQGGAAPESVRESLDKLTEYIDSI